MLSCRVWISLLCTKQMFNKRDFTEYDRETQGGRMKEGKLQEVWIPGSSNNRPHFSSGPFYGWSSNETEGPGMSWKKVMPTCCSWRN